MYYIVLQISRTKWRDVRFESDLTIFRCCFSCCGQAAVCSLRMVGFVLNLNFPVKRCRLCVSVSVLLFKTILDLIH